jgi:hypothetical protein
MQDQKHRAASRLVRHAAIVLCGLMVACDAPEPAVKKTAEPLVESALAAARLDLANKLPADEALVMLVSTLDADPGLKQALAMARDLLARTRWHMPELVLDHRRPIHRVHFIPPSSLWVSLTGDAETTVRWNLETPSIEALMFPAKVAASRSMVMDEGQRFMVIERGGATLLCNAQTLKPIRDLGPLPENLTPSSVIVFSSDGLLLAHPAYVSENDHSVLWHLRDSGSGEIIRSSLPDKVQPVSAWLDRKALRVVHEDGSVMEMPVAPVEEVFHTPSETPVSLLHAMFSEDGSGILSLTDHGPHRAPVLEGAPLETEVLLGADAWSRHPGIWSGLLREASLLKVDGNTVLIHANGHAPIHAASPITALTVGDGRVIVGEESGVVTFHRALPLPLETKSDENVVVADRKAVAAFALLAEALTGLRHDQTRGTTEQRLQAFKDCDLDAVKRLFPSLDFSPLVTLMQPFHLQTVPEDALKPLEERLDGAFGKLPENVLENLTKAFDSAEDKDVITAIEAAGEKGPVVAKALELSLASTRPEWIAACLSRAKDLPPLVRALAQSRIAWLQDRKADALTGWPDVFPDLQQVRLREDWDGWEQADFSQALETLRLCVRDELDAIEVPKDSTPEQRKAVAERLNDPATLKAVGRARFASACLKAALAFSSFKEEKENTFKLASLARDLGAAPEPCLRAEAMALTALGEYQHAHDRWIKLITEHPVAAQEPGDYAEAAYTAFENANPQQAMAILTTGLHRFPNDANFALRAGWVALLTGNSERAYRFLLTGRQIGYPPEKLENAIALLAIAAAQTGAAEDAAAFYQDLTDLDADWSNPETIESLEWPEELKSSLRQLVW